MAIDLKQLVQVDISGDYLWQTDKTGAYDVDINPGGWGGANFSLNESALVAISKRLDVDNEYIGGQIKYSNSSLDTDETQFQVIYPEKDGWIRLWLLRVWVSNDGIVDVSGDHSLATDDYFFIPAQAGKLWKKTDAGYDELIDWNELLDSGDTSNPYILMCEDIFYNKIAKYKNNILYKNYRKARLKDSAPEQAEILAQMNAIMHSVQGADYAFRSGLPNEANDIIESILDDYNIA